MHTPLYKAPNSVEADVAILRESKIERGKPKAYTALPTFRPGHGHKRYGILIHNTLSYMVNSHGYYEVI